MTQELKKRLIFFLSLFVLLGGLAFLLSPAPEQTRNMRHTRQEIESIKSELASDARFIKLKIRPGTSNLGMEILVVGKVPDQESLDYLKSMMEWRIPEEINLKYYIQIEELSEDPNEVDV